MEVISGTKRDITLMQWNELLQKAENRLAASKECQRKFGDHEDWVKKDEESVETIKSQIRDVINFMYEKNIQ